MVKIFIYTTVVILCSSLLSFLLYALGEEVSPAASTKGVTTENTPPPLSRNPFISAPYGRMDKTTVKSETNPSPQRIDKMEDIGKDLKVKGILLGGDHPAALVGHRVVKIGDRIGEFIITDITRTGVTLSKEDRVIQISVE